MQATLQKILEKQRLYQNSPTFASSMVRRPRSYNNKLRKGFGQGRLGRADTTVRSVPLQKNYHQFSVPSLKIASLLHQGNVKASDSTKQKFAKVLLALHAGTRASRSSMEGWLWWTSPPRSSTLPAYFQVFTKSPAM